MGRRVVDEIESGCQDPPPPLVRVQYVDDDVAADDARDRARDMLLESGVLGR